MEELDKSTQGTLLLERDGSALAEDGLSLAEKGIYCYDVLLDEGHNDEYEQIAVPKKPLVVGRLPRDIQDILTTHRILASADTDKRVHIERAY